MRWKLLWLVTTLAATAHIEGHLEGKEDVKNNGRWRREAAGKTLVNTDVGESSDTPIKVITTDLGKVEGYAWPYSDEIISYFDIPYGQFTAFEDPVKPEKWELHSATEHSKRCPQIYENTVIDNTDCLTLSIFTPKEPTDASVLFYIHESVSNAGSGDPSIYGPEYLIKEGIILVLPNYRLGTLGFLCLQNSTAPGNAALKDLALALEWIKNNIKAFGGDPSNIAISGDGTSGALAGYLALSTRSNQHISKVISESGSVLSHWAIDRNPIRTATRVADTVRNLTDNFIHDIFSNTSIGDLVRTTYSFSLKPCIEENSDGVITRNPWTILNDVAINMSFMIGSADHAALPMALQYDEDALLQLNETFESALPNDLNFPNANTRRDVEKRIKEQYFGSGDFATVATKNLSLYYTDVSYIGPDIRLARALVGAGATVYLYEFSFVGDFNNELQTIDSASRHGAIRGDVVGYLFSRAGRTPEKDSKEEKVIEMVTNLWVSFIKNGQPTAEGVIWNEFNATDDTLETWLSIDDETSLQNGFHLDRLKLWTEIYRDYFIDRSATTNMKADYIYYVIALVLIEIIKVY